jgi:hypothetical protein
MKVGILTSRAWCFLSKGVIATIVTASTSDFESLVDSAFDALVFGETKGGFPRPNSVRSMMEFILGIVTAPQMQSVPVIGKKKTKQPLEVFRESIRHVVSLCSACVQWLH